MAWRLETLRASVFAEEIGAIGLPKWQTLLEVVPQQVVNNPSANATIESGPFLNHRLIIAQQLGRADLSLVTFSPPSPVPLREPPFLGDLTILAEFLSIARRWVAIDANVRRLALFGTAWDGASSGDAALELILVKVPAFKKAPDERISDFLLQLNRPRPSKVDPATGMNRFVKWSAPILEIVSTPPSGPAPPVVRFPRAQVDIDINTVPSDRHIPGAILSQYLEEMGEMFREILDRGDVP
jgi:hypothetical protein